MTDERIRLEAYDPVWGERFEREAAALKEVLGEHVEGGVHHVGSTAVPGMTAKPIIDIMVGVRDLESSRGCIELVAGLDYLYAPYRTDVMHWFCKPDPARRTHHLHLVPVGSRRFADVLAFRDRLRSHPEDARRYAELKVELAQRYADDREAYTAGKGALIAALLRGGDES
ncbi:GrpB family protein [Actinoplanes sp. NPDC048796]|uniref:GrpB family protein n=1 Tax=unclassified Actinoplanes TaxID=2626549 RepID=UPI0033F1F78A